jgi:hypothetical protein
LAQDAFGFGATSSAGAFPRTAGSRISLAAMQALGAPLTDLIEVDVFGF